MTYVEWCRGSRKSTIHQGAAVCEMLDDPNETFLWDGDLKSKAAQKVYLIKEVFEDSYFIRLFGDLRGEKWKKDELILKRTVKTSDPTILASGLDASKTGGHYGSIFGDDLQTDDNAESADMNEHVKNNVRLYNALQRGKFAPIQHLDGTRWGFRDLGWQIQDLWEEERKKGLKPSVFISRKAGYKRNVVGGHNWRVAEFPEAGLDLGTLKRMRMTTKPMLFSFNILLEPYSAEDAPFKKDYLRFHDESMDALANKGAKFWLVVDPAGEGKFKGADFNALVVFAVTPKGAIYVMETVNKHLTQPGLFGEIVRLNERYPSLQVLVETYFAQYKLASWLKQEAAKNLVRINWVKFKPDKRTKSIRIEALEPLFMNGLIFLRRDQFQLEDQILTWTGKEEEGRHDDLLDCMGHLYKQMYIPTHAEGVPWYMDEDWANRPEYKEKEQMGKAPSFMWVQVRAAEERAKLARLQRSGGRFVSPGMRMGGLS